jgi:two-component system phosphate regulon sensor histidine kinase PhoR
MSTSEQDRQLRDLFHMIAVNATLEVTVSSVLKMFCQRLGATGAAFRSTEPALLVSVGELDTAALEAVPLATPNFAALDSTPGLLTCSVRSGETLLGVLWLGLDALTENQQAALSILLDALTIVVARAKAEAASAKSERLLNAALDNVSDPLLVFDTNWRLMLMNAPAAALFSAAQGQPLAEVVQSEALADFAQGQHPLDEWTVDEKSFIPGVTSVEGESGELWLLVLRDITQYKKLSHNQSEFVRIVAHDVRSPLTSMRGFADMMGMVGDLTAKQKQFVEKILSGINQITVLVDNIQDAGRFDMETGFYELTRSHCDMHDMVRTVVESQLIPEEKSGLSISVDVSDNVPIINADPTMLERAIANLVDNAVKYTQDGGKIEVRVFNAAENVVVSVQDNGAGITPEEQKQLFQRHVRLHRPEHKRIKGGGLGLFIVKSIAQRHGGDAWVSSKLGEGTTFSFSIPLKGANLVVPGDDDDLSEAAD